MIEKAFIKAQNYLSQNDYDPAVNSYLKIIKILDSVKISNVEKKRIEGDANLGLGHALRENGKTGDAIKCYERAKNFKKVDDISLICLSRNLFENRKFNAVTQLLETFPSKAIENKILLGRSYLKLGKPDQSVSVLRKACLENRSKWEVFYYLGCALGLLKDYKNAIKNFSTAKEVASDRACIYIQRGYAYFIIGQDEKAMQDYLIARELGESSEQLNLAFAAIHIHKREYMKAEKLLNDIKSSETRQLLFGHLYEQQNKNKEAITVYTSILEDGTSSVEACERLANVYIRINQFKKAEQYLNRAEQLGPLSNVAIYNLGWVCYKLNKLEKCVTHWSNISRLHPKKKRLDEQLAQVRCLLVQKYIQDGEFEKAMPVLSEYNRHNKEINEKLKFSLAEICFRAAQAIIKNGNNSGSRLAKKYLYHGDVMAPEDSRFKYYLALLEVNDENCEKAVSILESIKFIGKNDQRISCQLALCFAFIGKTELAEKELTYLLQEKSVKGISNKALTSLAAIKMQQEKWSDAAGLLLLQKKC